MFNTDTQEIDNLTVKRIFEVFDKNTTLKAKFILNDYRKATVSGIVRDVRLESSFDESASIVIEPSDVAECRPFLVYAEFDAPFGDDLMKRLLDVQKRERLSISGAIDGITQNSLTLKDVEFLNNNDEN